MQIRNPSVGSVAVRVAVATAIGSILLVPSLAFAAEAEKDDKDKKEIELDEVQVTGSRILRRDLDSNSPTITITSETFDNRSNIAVESALNELPQFIPGLGFNSDVNRREQLGTTSNQFGTLGSTNPYNTFSAGTTVGATSVSLRGLGANRNLVLLNGKRLVPVNASLSVDTSSIPSSALQRVEVVTGGASSVYGADAVSGVINFILKDNYQGADLDVQYGLSEIGDNQNLRVSGLVGGNFADGRGNAVIGLEYADRGSALQIDRDFYRRQLMQPYGGGGGNASFTEYVAGTSPLAASAATFGFAPGSTPSQAAIDAIYAGQPAGSVPRTSTFVINPNGTVFVAGDREGATRAQLNDGLQYKINQQNGQWVENNLIGRISSPLRRYSMFGSTHFDFTDDIRFYAQTTFAQSKTENVSNAGLASLNYGVVIPHGTGRNCATIGVTGDCSAATFATTPTLAQYRAGGSAGLNCPATGGCTNSQAYPVPPELAALLDSRVRDLFGTPFGPGANDDFVVNVPLNMFGPTRSTTNEATNFQIITGLSGNLPVRDWTYDVYTSYGTSRTTQSLDGAVSVAALRTLLRLPNYGRGAVVDGNVAPPSGTTFTHPTLRCTSGLPLFPTVYTGQISQDCIDAVQVDPVSLTKMNQSVVEGSFQGGLFELPAGDLRFAAGGSWRKNAFDFLPPDLASQSSVFDGIVGTNPIPANRSSDSVKDAFSELLVPVIKDVPFIKHLNLELGYRWSDYRYSGVVSTWKALADWAVTSNFRLRGGYQRANRAPNLVELFENRDNVAIGPGDPCSTGSPLAWGANPTAVGNTPAKAAAVRNLCEQMMGPQGAQSYYTTTSNATDFGFSFDSVRISGNRNLKSEKSGTWTLGTVLRSPFSSPLAQFTTTIDYFKIRVDDSIGNPQLFSLNGGIYRHCFDATYNTTLDPNDINCQQLLRDPNTGRKLPNIPLPYQNVGAIISQGVDLSFNWSAALADLGVGFIPGRISVGTNTNYMIKDARQTATGEPFEEFTGISGFGSFRWSMANSFSWFNGPFNSSLRWRHYPSMVSYARFSGQDVKTEGIETYDILDMSFGYSFSRRLALRFGVDNLLDRDPPIDGFNPGVSGPGSTGYTPGNIANGAYSVTGRSYYAGVKLSF